VWAQLIIPIYGNLTVSGSYPGGDNDYVDQDVTSGSSPYFGNIYVGNRLYHYGDTNTSINFTADNISFTTGGDEILELEESTYQTINMNARYVNFKDDSGNSSLEKYSTSNYLRLSRTSNISTSYLGTSTLDWEYAYIEKLYYSTIASYDIYDDLYELSKIESKKIIVDGKEEEVKDERKQQPIMDPLSLRREFTNYDDISRQLKEDNGNLISDEDIEILIQDEDEAGHLLRIDLGMLSSLTTGAVRQLDSEVISMFELLSSRITALENKLNAKE